MQPSCVAPPSRGTVAAMASEFLLSERAEQAVQCLLMMRAEAGAPQYVPNTWMDRLVWLGRHTDPGKVGPMMLAAMVIACEWSSRGH